jgi:hypothetical protein
MMIVLLLLLAGDWLSCVHDARTDRRRWNLADGFSIFVNFPVFAVVDFGGGENGL